MIFQTKARSIDLNQYRIDEVKVTEVRLDGSTHFLVSVITTSGVFSTECANYDEALVKVGPLAKSGYKVQFNLAEIEEEDEVEVEVLLSAEEAEEMSFDLPPGLVSLDSAVTWTDTTVELTAEELNQDDE